MTELTEQEVNDKIEAIIQQVIGDRDVVTELEQAQIMWLTATWLNELGQGEEDIWNYQNS